jgi:hypothetical protein
LKAVPRKGRPPRTTGRQTKWIYNTVTINNPLQFWFEFALWTHAMTKALIRKKLWVSMGLVQITSMRKALYETPAKPFQLTTLCQFLGILQLLAHKGFDSPKANLDKSEIVMLLGRRFVSICLSKLRCFMA